MIALLAIFFVTYALIASEKVDKAVAAFLGAAVVLGFHFISYEKALHHVDLNVIFLIIGMMVIVNIFSRTGLFEWLAMTVSKASNGNGFLIVVQLLLITAFFSALLDNVTTVILIVPMTILITQILEIPAIPVLILESIFSNIGGTATLVGDPPNIIIGSSANLTFNDFLINLGPVIVVVAIVSLLLIALFMRKRFWVQGSAKQRILKSQPELAIQDRRMLITSLSVFGLVVLGFVFGRLLNIEAGVIALAGGLLMSVLCRVSLHELLGKVEWTTIIFFIGLFMLVGALQESGIFTFLGTKLIGATRGNLLLTTMTILWVSAIASAIIDNIPLVIAIIPLIHSIIPLFAQDMGIAGHPQLVHEAIKAPLFWSLALGACLGGNGSLLGASANVVVSQIAKKNNYHLTFMRFFRFGVPMMLLSLVLCTIYLYLRYFV